MKKLLNACVLPVWFVIASVGWISTIDELMGQSGATVVVGTPGVGAGTTGTCSVTTSNWCAFEVMTYTTRTLNTVQLVLNATGTAGAGEIIGEIQTVASTGGPSGTVVATSSSTTPTAITGLASSTFVLNFSQSLTAQTLYWVVVKNTGAGTVTLRNASGSSSSYPASFFGQYGGQISSFQVSVNTGGVWTGSNGFIAFARFGWSDTTYSGYPYINLAVDTTNTIYSTREVGTRFVTPLNATLNVRGVCMGILRGSNPTGNLRYALYYGTSGTLTTSGYTNKIAAATMQSASSPFCLYFDTVQVIPPGTTVRVAAGEGDQTDANTLTLRVSPFNFPTDSGSLSLLPFTTTTEMTFCPSSCTAFASWSAVTGFYVPFVLMLEPDAEFGASGSGGAFTFID